MKFIKRRLFGETVVFAVVAIAIVIFSVCGHGSNFFFADNSYDNIVASTSISAIEGNYILKIDKINVNAPIVLNVDGKNKSYYLKSLEQGIAHMKDTALPGEEGNVFIFGHSSYYTGDYREVFARLNEIETGDEITIKSSANEYKYKIYNKEIISADQMDVLKQPKGKSIITLMTCWPLGTTEKRLIVVGELETQ